MKIYASQVLSFRQFTLYDISYTEYSSPVGLDTDSSMKLTYHELRDCENVGHKKNGTLKARLPGNLNVSDSKIHHLYAWIIKVYVALVVATE